MRFILLFTLGVFISFTFPSCEEDSHEDKTEVAIIQTPLNLADTLNMGCLSAYEINYAGNKDTINRTYGDKKIKDGYWIIFGLSNSSEKSSTVPQLARIKLADGYYKKNKKEGFWKFYKEDGSLKDSVEYKNDVQITP
jgi:antitoxin component YwqK of YwqJK toxin-antitoxin module